MQSWRLLERAPRESPVSTHLAVGIGRHDFRQVYRGCRDERSGPAAQVEQSANSAFSKVRDARKDQKGKLTKFRKRRWIRRRPFRCHYKTQLLADNAGP